MKDFFLLVVTGLLAAVLAWAFWHFLRADVGAVVLVLIVLLGLRDENSLLRRQLKRLK